MGGIQTAFDATVFLTEDVINLLKTGLYETLTREEIDHFEQYVRFAEIKGLAAFFS